MSELIPSDEIPKTTKYDLMSKEEVVQRHQIALKELERLVKDNYELREKQITLEQANFLIEEQIDELRNKEFGCSSERYKKSDSKKEKGPSKPRVQKPSERYPNISIRTERLTISPSPQCQCCGSGMSDSGMSEDSEQLTVIPKKYEVLRQQRVKYRCESCHGSIQTAPAPARIKEGSTYSDEMIIDVSLSKYLDLIPIERYAAMARRTGLIDIPPHSLIECSHYLADFLERVYLLIKGDVLKSRVVHADETPHKMLEGHEKKSWYLWGFSTLSTCFLECHDTRSGDVASDILIKSDCQVLVTDVYSGYGKAINVANIEREKNKKSLIVNANCNAHARRYFFKARNKYTKCAEFYLDQYHEIYKLNADSHGKNPAEILELREQMRPYFEAMKKKAEEDIFKYPKESKLGKGMGYFWGNYQGLTRFLDDAEVPIDNNSQERLLRSHVVGRKTWYGTHSERGAKTAAVLFTIIETCKLNKVNPREYFEKLVKDLLAGKKPYTPSDFIHLGKN
jgi:transposase